MRKRTLDIMDNESEYPFLVAEYEGKVVGHRNLHAYSRRDAYQDTAEDTIYIDRNNTGRVIGSKLMQSLIKEAEKLNFSQLLGIVGGRDNAASIQLHKKCGLGYRHGRWIELIFLEKVCLQSGFNSPSHQ